MTGSERTALIDQYRQQPHVISVTQDGPQTVIVETLSTFGARSFVRVRRGGLVDWLSGELIQNAFPDLTAGERELLMTGYTDEEWDQMFDPVEVPADTTKVTADMTKQEAEQLAAMVHRDTETSE